MLFLQKRSSGLADMPTYVQCSDLEGSTRIVNTSLNIYKLDAESRELRDLESRGPDVASRA